MLLFTGDQLQNVPFIDMDNEFICPECGSKEYENQIFVSKEPTKEKNKDPWASVLQQMKCSSCKKIIPAHLGERWDNISIEYAQKEWKELYRKTNHLQNF